MKPETPPQWICATCGERYGQSSDDAMTWHNGGCDVCGKVRGVTAAEHFGTLNLDWKNERTK